MTGKDFQGVRVRLCLSQAELALLLGVAQATVSRIENERKEPSHRARDIMELAARRLNARRLKRGLVRSVLQTRGPLQALGLILST